MKNELLHVVHDPEVDNFDPITFPLEEAIQLQSI